MDNNQNYTAEASVVAEAHSKKRSIKYILLGVIAIALIIAVAIVVSNFMSKSPEEPNDLFYKNRVAFCDVDEDGEELWGYADKKGKKVIKAKYSEAYNFAECGLALICDQNGFYGYINTKGQTVIKAQFIAASSFNEDGVAVVVNKEGEYGVINKKGEYVVKPNSDKYAEIGEFNEYGTAPFKNAEDKWGFINTKGKVVVPAKYDEVENFNEKGITVVYDKEDDAWGVINSKGKWIFKPKFDSVSGFDKFNRCIVEIDGEYGIIDQSGKYVVKPKYAKIYDFSDDGLAIFKNEDGEYGVINTKGKEVVEASYEDIKTFHDGVAIAFDGKTYVLINKSGKEIAEFDDCQPIGDEFAANGLILVEEVLKKNSTKTPKYGYANKNGEIVVDFDYVGADQFAKNGLALVYDGKDYGYINKGGEYVIDAMYDAASRFYDDGYAITSGVDDDGDRYFIIISKNKEIAKFDKIEYGFSTELQGDPYAIVDEDDEDYDDDDDVEETETTASVTTSKTESTTKS